MRILIDARGLAACALLPLLAAAAVRPSPAPTPAPRAVLTWWPERPVQGRLFVVRVAAAPEQEGAGGLAGGASPASSSSAATSALSRVGTSSASSAGTSAPPAATSASSPASTSPSPSAGTASEAGISAATFSAGISAAPFSAEGAAAGEPLHFGPSAAGGLESLAAVPVGEEESVDVVVAVRYEDGTLDSLRVSVPVAAGDYRHERLTVAPQFGREPDAAQSARLERDRAKAREVSRRAHETPRLWRDAPVMPRESRVTSGFGDGRVFNGQVSSRHMGLDLAGDPGEEVRAAARGVVALVDEFLLAGNIVYVNHGGGLVSGYFHLSEQLVAEGDTVEAGTPIGRVGATGRVTGPHLHWVVRYGSTSVDPRSLLEVADGGTATADGAPGAR